MNPEAKRILLFQLIPGGALGVWAFTDTSPVSVIAGTVVGVLFVALVQRQRSREREAMRHAKRMESRELGSFYMGPGGLTVDLYKMVNGKPVAREIFTTEDGETWHAWPSGNSVFDVDWLRTHYKFWVGSGGVLGQPLIPTPARVDETLPKEPPF